MDFKKDFIDTCKKFKRVFLKFWRSENSKISLFRDVFVALLIVLIIITALWTYTGQWWGTPMVAIESGSMQHPDPPFGRIGTIDAGDMVLLVKVNDVNDIVPRGSNMAGAYADKKSENYQYGDYGDVIVYRPYGLEDSEQIIHRAMCWVQYHSEYDTYSVPDYKIENKSTITIEELGLNRYVPSNPYSNERHSGYITMGDNPETNKACDQEGGICTDLIRLEWISGKARGELPWIGTLNLIFNDVTQDGEDTVGNVPSDSITCLLILIFILISIPVSLDIHSWYKEKKDGK